MKIVHISLCGPVTDGFAYQDNLLTKYHKKLGFDVTLITSKWVYNNNGKIIRTKNDIYINDDGVKVVRLDNSPFQTISNKFIHYIGLKKVLESEKPDIIFVHGVQFWELPEVVAYTKHYTVRVYVDNHADFANSGRNIISRNIFHKCVWRWCAHKIEPYTTKFYGVLPARVDFLKDVYNVPENKVDLLVMGGDDDVVNEVVNPKVVFNTRQKYNISKDDFLVVTGGKINNNRLETLELMKAIADIGTNVKLLVFGSVSKELNEEFDALCTNKNIIYAGWVNAKTTNLLMASADLVVFPGLHSVMWEQAVALGRPCIFRKIDGFNHVDLGGNAVFLNDVDRESLKKAVKNIALNKALYNSMEAVAKEKGMMQFSYMEIAKKSIQMEEQ